jgi:hypothetical protein
MLRLQRPRFLLLPHACAPGKRLHSPLPPDMIWSEHLSNAKEVNTLFPAGDVSLSGLLLLRLEYLPGNKLTLSFLQQKLPSIIPDRWNRQNIVGLELRFSLGVSLLELNLPEEFTNMPSLSVSVERARLQVRNEVSSSLLLFVNSFYIELKIRPLDSIPNQ